MNADNNIVNLHDVHDGPLSTAEVAGYCTDESLQAFRSVLEAIRNQVLVPARDIRAPQRHEIARELSIMYQHLEIARKARGLPDLPGTCHLMRERDIERLLREEIAKDGEPSGMEMA